MIIAQTTVFTIVNYDHNRLIVQATGIDFFFSKDAVSTFFPKKKLPNSKLEFEL